MLPFIAPIDFKQKPTDPIVPLPTAPQAQSTLGQVLSGAYNGAVKPAVEFMESPVGFASLGLGAAPAAIQKGAAALFAPYAAYNGVRDTEAATQATNPQDIATHATSALANLLGGFAAMRAAGAGRYLPGKGEAGSVGLGSGARPKYTYEHAMDEYGDISPEFDEAVRRIAAARNLGITSDRNLSHVALDPNGKVVGGAFVSDDPYTYSFDVAVDQAHEGRGVGSGLLDRVIRPDYDAPYESTQVDVVNPTMRAMLEKRGYGVTQQIGPDRWIMSPGGQ